MRWIGLIPVICAAVVFLYSARDLPPTGDVTSPASTHVSPRYIERGEEETGAPNLVTGVLIDYRGYDTLGETTVIFVAGIACLLLLGFRRSEL